MKRTFGFRILALFTAVILLLTISIAALVGWFSRSFIKEEIARSNTLQVAQISSDAALLLAQLKQFSAGLYDITCDFQPTQGTSALEIYALFQEEAALQTQMQQELVYADLRSYVTDAWVYYAEETQYFWGDGVLLEELQWEDYAWHEVLSNTYGTSIFYGPVQASYKATSDAKTQVVLYLSKINQVRNTDEMAFTLIALDYEALSDMFSVLQSDSRGVVVTDEWGNIIYQENYQPEMQAVHQQILSDEGQEVGSASLETQEQEGYYFTYVAIDGFGWTVTTIDDTSVLFASANELLLEIVLIVFVLGTVAILVAMYGAQRATFPVHALMQFIRTMEKDLDTFIESTSKDEFAEIGAQFNHMKRNIQASNAKVYLEQVRANEAQISALQAQMNPHFIYNTLDSIYSIAIVEEIPLIANLTQNLADMMRYSVGNQSHYSKLSDEITHAKAYVGIVNIRYDDWITLDDQISAQYYDVCIPKLVLQPLVENAWTHGVSRRAGKDGVVSLRASPKGEFLEIVVTDNGAGMSKERLQAVRAQLVQHADLAQPQQATRGNNVALLNVHQRLMLLSKDQYGLEIQSEEGVGCRVSIKIPLTPLDDSISLRGKKEGFQEEKSNIRDVLADDIG